MRVRFFSLISYAPREFIHNVCVRKSKYFAYIYHYRDVNDYGEVVSPHFHILLITDNNHEPTAVCKWFRGTHGQNTFAEEVYSSSIFDYLTHTGFEDKFQYSIDDIVSNDISKFQTDMDIKHVNTMSLLDDIISKKSMRYLASHYGRDFVLNSRKYISFANQMSYEEKFNIRILEVATPIDLPDDFFLDDKEYDRFVEYLSLRNKLKPFER